MTTKRISEDATGRFLEVEDGGVMLPPGTYDFEDFVRMAKEQGTFILEGQDDEFKKSGARSAKAVVQKREE